MNVDIALLKTLVKDGYLTCRPHPKFPFLIWNYTSKTAHERYWTAETLMCRGLITDAKGTVVSRPLTKFFNWEELESIPDVPFTVTMKMDGSLGISYVAPDGMPRIATRGSFTSWQAERATKILHEKYPDMVPFLVNCSEMTFLFEIIIPENRIVVDYGDTEDLVLLAILDTETGYEYNSHRSPFHTFRFPIVKSYDIQDINELLSYEAENEEGFVVRFESGLRAKIKLEEYKRLHRIITGVNPRSIWEYLKEGKSLAHILDRVPPAFSAWVKTVTKGLTKQYDVLHKRVEDAYKEVVSTTSIPVPFPVKETLSAPQCKTIERDIKKAIQERFAEYPDIEPFLYHKWNGAKYIYPDGKRIGDTKAALRLYLWDALYPEHTQPFLVDGEEEEL